MAAVHGPGFTPFDAGRQARPTIGNRSVVFVRIYEAEQKVVKRVDLDDPLKVRRQQ